MPKRREFLKYVAGTSARMLLLGSRFSGAFAQSDPTSKRRQVMVGGRRVKTVDMHMHTTVPEVADLLKGTPLERRGNAGTPMLLDAERLVRMDRDGIDVRAASINPF